MKTAATRLGRAGLTEIRRGGMYEPILTCLCVGSLTALLTAVVAVVLHRTIRIGAGSGRVDAPSLRRLALLRAWLGVLLLSGIGIAVLMVVTAIPLASGGPASFVVTRALLRGFLWLYCVWLPAAAFAIPITGRWGRQALRSFPVLRGREARGRLLWSRLRRSRPATAVREFARRHDRALW